MEENNTVTNSKEDEAMEVATSSDHSQPSGTVNEPQTSNTDRVLQQPSTPSDHSQPSGTVNEPQTSNTDRVPQQPSTPSNNDPNIGEDDEQPEKRELTRSKMALLFVLGFFSILFLCFAYAIRVKASISDLKDVLVAIIGALSGTLGFIVGFYYKSIKE